MRKEGKNVRKEGRQTDEQGRNAKKEREEGREGGREEHFTLKLSKPKMSRMPTEAMREGGMSALGRRMLFIFRTCH